jgi:N-acetylneuraminic acid mutarotase
VCITPIATPNAVLFGGRTLYVDLADTWLFNGTDWHSNVLGAPPPARSAHAMATLAGRAVVMGGQQAQEGGGFLDLQDTWSFDGVTWTQFNGWSPDGRHSHAMATLGKTIVLFGGQVGSIFVNDTWTFDGDSWTQVQSTTSPSPRMSHAMASLGDRVVLFGGMDAQFQELDDTWTFDGSTWTPVATDQGPSARQGHAMATMGTNVILFGGSAGNGDTWSFDGAKWLELSPLSSPPDVTMHSMASLGPNIVLFGGAYGPGTVPSTETWWFDNGTWTQVPNWMPIDGRSGAAMATIGSSP